MHDDELIRGLEQDLEKAHQDLETLKGGCGPKALEELRAQHAAELRALREDNKNLTEAIELERKNRFESAAEWRQTNEALVKALEKAKEGKLSRDDAASVLGSACAHEWDPSIRGINRYCMKCKGREDLLKETLRDFRPAR